MQRPEPELHTQTTDDLDGWEEAFAAEGIETFERMLAAEARHADGT